MTPETDEALRELLALGDYCSPSIAAFADAYRGTTVQFDANIGSMSNHGEYASRYDISIGAGDFSGTSASGPAFQFRDVNMSDLHLTGQNVPDTIGVGDQLVVTAEVGDYEDSSCLFLLRPVATELR